MSKKIIGENIRALRDNIGFSQTSIANFLHVDQSLISKIEKGERSISADMLEKLADLFGVAVDALENPQLEASKLTFAFRGSDLSTDDMEAICAINKIALNAELMQVLLEENKR